MAWHFDGDNDYVTLADNAILTLPDGDWTIAGWVKLDDSVGETNWRILDWGVDGGFPYFSIFIDVGGNRQLAFIFTDDDNTSSGTIRSGGTPFVSNSNWTHILIQRSGDTITSYINGIATSGFITNASFDTCNPSANLYFGIRADLNRDFSGDLAEWAKWDRALNANERSGLASGIYPGFYTSELAWYVPMREGDYTEKIVGITVTNNDTTGANHPTITRPLTGSTELEIQGTGLIGTLRPLTGQSQLEIQATGRMAGSVVLRGDTELEIQGQGSIARDNYLTGLAALAIQGEGFLDTDIGFLQIRPDYLENAESDIFLEFPDDELYYGSAEDEIGGKRYYDRLAGLPVISEQIPEFYAGIEPPQQTSITFEDLDGEILNHRKLGKFKRNNRVIAYEKWRAKDFETELINIYRGFIGSSSPGVEFYEIASQSSQLDIFGQPFPDTFVDTEKWPNAEPSDLGAPVGFFVGTAKHIPCALILSQDDGGGVDFRYVVCERDKTITAVYNNGRYMDEYTGAFQSGSTTTNWKLSASDTRNDDFYNDMWITNNANGQTRRITDYTKSTKIAIVTPSGTAPTSGQSYTIRRWRKLTETIAGKTYTELQFVIPMYDLSGNKLTKDNITADVSDDETERIPVRAIQNLLSRYTDRINTAAFDNAAAYLASIPNLRCDGGVYDPRQMGDITEELCHIGRCRLTRDGEGNLYPVIDGTQDTVIGPFKIDTMARVGVPHETPAESVWKDLTIRFRRQFNTNNYTLKTSPHDVLPDEGTISEVKSYDFLHSKEAADMVCDYLAKMKKTYDFQQSFSFAYEARDVKPGDLLNIQLPEFGKESIYEVLSRSASGIDIELGMAEYDATRTMWTEGEYFDDPIGEGIDYSKTPPDAVTSLGISWQITTFNVSAKAALTWVNPSVNFDHVIIEYKRSADSLWTFAGTSNGTKFEIPGLTPGIQYDFRLTSINIFNFPPQGGGVASLVNQLAPGDTSAPAKPTGLTSSVKFNIAEFTWNPNSETDLAGYEYEIRTSASTGETGGGSLIQSGFIENNNFTYKLTDGSLTTAITRHFRIRAIDWTARSTGSSATKSLWTATVSATSGDVQRLDIRTNDVTKLGQFFAQSSTMSNNPMSLSVTTIGKPIVINLSWTLASSAGLILTLLEDGNPIMFHTWSFPNLAEPGAHAMVIRRSPSAGAHTYTLQAGNNPGMANRSMWILEAKNE